MSKPLTTAELAAVRAMLRDHATAQHVERLRTVHYLTVVESQYVSRYVDGHDKLWECQGRVHNYAPYIDHMRKCAVPACRDDDHRAFWAEHDGPNHQRQVDDASKVVEREMLDVKRSYYARIGKYVRPLFEQDPASGEWASACGCRVHSQLDVCQYHELFSTPADVRSIAGDFMARARRAAAAD